VDEVLIVQSQCLPAKTLPSISSITPHQTFRLALSRYSRAIWYALNNLNTVSTHDTIITKKGYITQRDATKVPQSRAISAALMRSHQTMHRLQNFRAFRLRARNDLVDVGKVHVQADRAAGIRGHKNGLGIKKPFAPGRHASSS
jgi:hypothetical protein